MMRGELITQEGFRYDESYRSAQDYNFAARVARKFNIGVTPDYRQAAKLIPLFLEQNQKTKIYAQKELEEELKRLLYQWMIRSKSVKTILQAVGVCGVSFGNLKLLLGKETEILFHKVREEQ